MALQFSSFLRPPPKKLADSLLLSPHSTCSFYTPLFLPYKIKLSTCRLPAKPSALISERSSNAGENKSHACRIELTYLEGNSWLWDLDGFKILVDPVLVGNLDFGIPFLYDASKKVIKNFQLNDLPEIDCLLITQSLDDHCHIKTLKPLSVMLPDLLVISTPNAEGILTPLFKRVLYLAPGQSSEVEGRNGFKVTIRATAGPVLGPPWQRPENGYIAVSSRSHSSLYYEPHCVYNPEFLETEQVDIVITPVIKQLLPSFTLVSGQEDAVRLAKLLRAKFVVAMNNGDLDSKGLLSSLLYAEGTVDSFNDLLSKELYGVEVLQPTPGVPLTISSSENY